MSDESLPGRRKGAEVSRRKRSCRRRERGYGSDAAKNTWYVYFYMFDTNRLICFHFFSRYAAVLFSFEVFCLALFEMSAWIGVEAGHGVRLACHLRREGGVV